MTVPHNALVLVADGRKFLLFRNHGDAARIDLRTEDHGQQPDLKDRELHTDAPGTQGQRFGDGRPAMEETDFHQQSEDRFATSIADALNHRALTDDVIALAVIAPPKTMGVLRAAWHPTLADKIICELTKDMTGRTTPDIEHLLEGLGRPPG